MASDREPESGTSAWPAVRDGLFDFRSTSGFATHYLDTFYRDQPPTNDERAVVRFLVERLRERPPGGTVVEVGCGPTIHHALPFAPYVASIHLADYLPENLAEVERWRVDAPGCMDWGHYSRLVLELEGQHPAAGAERRRERDVRTKIERLLHCDLQREHIFGDAVTYAAVAAFYCTEEVGISMTAWEQVLANLTRVVAPGGRLYLACLRDTDRYLVGDTMYPCARIAEADVIRVLAALGYDMAQTVVEAAVIPDQQAQGVVGVVLAEAVKRR